MNKIHLKRFHILDKLRDGNFGVVYTGIDRRTNKEIILKINKNKEMNAKESEIIKALNIK